MKISIYSLVLLAASLKSTSNAFMLPAASSSSGMQSITLHQAATPLVEKETFFRAVECAEGSRATVDELDKLATQLEDVDGCKFEEGETCEQEIRDRMDVAQILRLRIELKLRTDYLKKSNLFASDVHKSHDADERKKFRAMLEANREKAADGSEGSDLGLWE